MWWFADHFILHRGIFYTISFFLFSFEQDPFCCFSRFISWWLLVVIWHIEQYLLPRFSNLRKNLSLFFFFRVLLLRMMSMTCHNLDFERAKFDLVAFSYSSNASIDRYSVRNYAKFVFKNCNRDYASKRLIQ